VALAATILSAVFLVSALILVVLYPK